MDSPDDDLANCDRLDKWLDLAFKHPFDLSQQADLYAEILRWICPEAPLYGCCLRAVGDTALAIFDGGAQRREDWLPHFPPSMLLQNPTVGRAVPLMPVPAALGFPDQRLALQTLTFRESGHGALFMLVPKAVEPQEKQLRWLSYVARQMSLRQEVEVREQERLALVRDLAKQAAGADYGELLRSLGHEFNNFLNVLLLHVAVLEQEFPERAAGDLAELRGHGKNLAETMKRLQLFRQQQRPSLRPIQLNAALRSAVQTMNWTAHGKRGQNVYVLPVNQRGEPNRSTESLTLSLELANEPSHVLAAPPDLDEFCAALLNLAIETAQGGKCSIRLRTTSDADRVTLELEEVRVQAVASKSKDKKPLRSAHGNPAALPQVAVDLCESLTRRLHGRLHYHVQDDAGWRFRFDVPLYREPVRIESDAADQSQRSGMRA